jgi:site-specific DNA recombinase
MAPRTPPSSHPAADPADIPIDAPVNPRQAAARASQADAPARPAPSPLSGAIALGLGAGLGDPVGAGPIRLAFLGRTSTVEHQDPTLSIPRQHHNAQAALPPGATIVCNFYDVESGRKELDERGLSRAHELFDIPLRRDGGLADLLAEATRPDRRFDAVICESIARVARVTYFGTKLEYELQRAGIILVAADEPRDGKHSTKILTRRIKQSIAEWYVLELLEASREGLEQHTLQGWNTGHPPHGYLAERIPHPVPAKRAEGKTKTRLLIDPQRAPAVAQIFAWRVGERLGYASIAKRLNRDPDRYPPPIPNRPNTAKGGWTASAVADILRNPKYTGYMVWNRYAGGTGTTRRRSSNPPDAWVWSPQPTHQAIVSLELWRQAQQIGRAHRGSRDGADPNRHPHTKRTYLLRSHVRCVHCRRRLCGRTITHRNRAGEVTSQHVYYRCPLPEADGELMLGRHPDHPSSVYVREDHLLDGLLGFFAERVFHPDRRDRLGTHLRRLDQTARQHLQRQQAGLQRAIDDLDARKRRLVRALALNDSLDHDDEQATLVVDELRQNLQELDQQRHAKLQELAALADQHDQADAVELLDALPIAADGLPELPEPVLRGLFAAFQLHVDYDRHANWATVQVTLRGDNAAELQAVARHALRIDQPTGTKDRDTPPGDAQPTTVTHALVVPPEIAVATPAVTIASSRRPVVASSVPPWIRSPRPSRLREKVRMVTSGPSGAIGGSTAWKRWPPGSRASTQGRASSTRRPSGATTRCTSAASAAVEGSLTEVSSSRPCRSTQTSSGPLTSTSVMAGSASNGASGPRPVSSSVTARTVAANDAAGSTMPSSRRAEATAI